SGTTGGRRTRADGGVAGLATTARDHRGVETIWSWKLWVIQRTCHRFGRWADLSAQQNRV
ncbi:MAG TPA: hypothetical protein VGK40_01020, partial [Verrucomicrobiae bacterium]